MMDREFITHMIDAEQRGYIDIGSLCRNNAGSIMELLHELHGRSAAHEVCEQHGLTRERLEAALKSNDNWGKLTHSFEYLTACSAVLATWPDPLSHPPVRMES